MIRDAVARDYFEWLCDLVCGKRYSKQVSFDKLLLHLHNIEFIALFPKDENRGEDGITLRYRFARYMGYRIDILDTPCSVFEMMVALAIRCEEDYMDDPAVGDRTGQWFWGMIVSLGLGFMIDRRYDAKHVDDVIFRFLHRDYEPNGKGGLFTVRNCPRDLRDVEIWTQMCLYLDTII